MLFVYVFCVVGCVRLISDFVIVILWCYMFFVFLFVLCWLICGFYVSGVFILCFCECFMCVCWYYDVFVLYFM